MEHGRACKLHYKFLSCTCPLIKYLLGPVHEWFWLLASDINLAGLSAFPWKMAGFDLDISSPESTLSWKDLQLATANSLQPARFS